MSKTVAELMAELEKNDRFKEKIKVQEELRLELEEKYSLDEKTLVDELNGSGFSVNSVWDFVNAKNDYSKAESILVKHLKIQHHPKILAGIARSLATTDFSHNDELWNLLADLYAKTPSDADIDTPEERGAQQAIAVALECLATETRAVHLKDLIETSPNGDGIQWLRERLGKIGATAEKGN